jgi:uncharacterized MAPEG superfamily protein
LTIALACIPVALALVYGTKVPLSIAMAKEPGRYDNKNPRAQQAKLAGWGQRAHAAHLNGFEAFAPFAAGVLVAHVTGADSKWSTILAVAFVVSRAIYPVLYMANLDKARSLVWAVGLASTFGLLLLPYFS